MAKDALEAAAQRQGEENYWGFLGFWEDCIAQLAEEGVEVRFLISECFLPYLETEKACSRLEKVKGCKVYCLPDEYFYDMWQDQPDALRDAAILKSLKLGDMQPDIVQMHDPLHKLRFLFPDASIVGQEVGAYSRPPYPSTFFIDPLSFDCKGVVEEYCAIQDENMTQATDVLTPLRHALEDKFKLQSPEIQAYLDDLRSRFRNVLVFAVQYPSPRYSPYTQYATSIEIYRDILENTPADTVVILCPRAHNFQDMGMTEDGWTELTRQYVGAALFPGELAFPYYTQMLVPHTDGVVAVTSTVGLQAALWGKHWFTSPQSFYRGITPSYKEMAEVLTQDGAPEAWGFVNWMSQYMWHPKMVLKRGSLLADYLKLVRQVRQSGEGEILPHIKKFFDARPQFQSMLLNPDLTDLTRKHGSQVIDVMSI